THRTRTDPLHRGHRPRRPRRRRRAADRPPDRRASRAGPLTRRTDRRDRCSQPKSGDPVSDVVDERPHNVVINDEEQYSIWPAAREVPAGWRATGFGGTKAECLAHVEEVWTDMRPLSLRRASDN